MRLNLPVTNDEYDVPSEQNLVSITDLHGTILDCNDAFEAASGFTKAEIIGQPHNLIRHPDVPPAVFKDLWQSLQKGIPWTQYVKNRRKNGGFYWVLARATPIYKDGKVSGYMSVRSRIENADKQAAAKAYNDIKNGKATIQYGKVHYGFNLSQINLLSRLGAVAQMVLISLLLFLVPAASQLLGLDLVNAGIGYYVFAAIMSSLLILFGLKMDKTQQETIQELNQLAGGQPLDDSVEYSPLSFSGKIKNGIIAANLAFLYSREESAYQLDKARQLQLALDKVGSFVMMTDTSYRVTYLNNCLYDFIKNNEPRIKTDLPDFELNKLKGRKIYKVLSSHEDLSASALDKVTTSKVLDAEIAGYHFRVSITPVYNRAGVKVSVLFEWQNRTQDVQLIDNIYAAVAKARQGNLSDRISLERTDGVVRDLSEAINELLGTIHGAVDDVISVVTAVSQGDLTKNLDNDFEAELGALSQALNSSISRLNSTVSGVMQAAYIVSNASSTVSQGAHSLSERVQEQAAMIEQTTATMAKINTTLQSNTESAQQAAVVAQNVQSQVSQGIQVMRQTIDAMNIIQQSSHQISDIVNVIDSIAFQTNLLALNAAVEAARAGDHGRGFAVVAGEVRALAQKSAEAARNITSLISESVLRIDQGTKLASESGEVLNGISGAINQVAEMVFEISKASTAQQDSMDQINTAINTIDKVTQQNAALVDETTSSAESLSNQAQKLANDMGFFKINTSQPDQVMGIEYKN